MILRSTFFIFLCFVGQGLFAQLDFTDEACHQAVIHSYSGTGACCSPCCTGTMSFTGGVSFADFTGDGLDDLSIATDAGATIRFFENRHGHFIEIPALVPDTSDQRMINWVDFDNDGDKDLFLTSYGLNRLYENDGNLVFTDISIAAGFNSPEEPSVMSVWSDYDKDGYTDVYVINYDVDSTSMNHLYRNNGNGTFSDVAISAGASNGYAMSLAACFMDYDNDGWADIYVANDKFHPNAMLRNNGNGTFSDVSVASGSDIVIDAMNAGYGDYDQDGDLDIYVTNGPLGNELLINNGDGTFQVAGPTVGVGFYNESWAGNFFDCENDGDLDLYVSGAGVGTFAPSSELYVNNGNDTFSTAALPGMAGDTLGSYAHAFGDFDANGQVDIMVVNRSPYLSQLWMNQGSTGNWIRIEPEGTLSNKDGIGVWIKVYAGGQQYVNYTHNGIGFLGQFSNAMHFGLGNVTQIDSVVLDWPSGIHQVEMNLPVDQSWQVIEGTSMAPLTTIISSKAPWLCNGDTLILNSGNAVSHLWSTGATTSTIQVTMPGNYWVVNTSNGQSDTAWIDITTTGTPVSNPSVTDVLCYGESTGSIDVHYSGGISPYMIHWDDNNMNFVRPNMPAGSYPYMLMDRAECMMADTIVINEPPQINSNIYSPEDTVCFSTFSIDVSSIATGGVPPFAYNWNTGSTTSDAVPNGTPFIGPGSYNVIITDANNCVVNDSIYIHAADSIFVTEGHTDHIGATLGTGWVTAIGGTPPFTYLWSDPLAQTTDTAYNLTTGTYQVTVTDAMGCTRVAYVFIDLIDGIPTLSAESISVYPNPAKEALHIDWSKSGAADVEILLLDMTGRTVYKKSYSGQNTVLSLNDLAPGTYVVRVHSEKGSWRSVVSHR